MKKIMIIGLVILSVFLIYLCNLDKKVYYLSLNNYNMEKETEDYSKYVKNYLKEKEILEIYLNGYSTSNMTPNKLLNDIKQNKKIRKKSKEITLKNALIKADLVTLSFNQKEIMEKIHNDDFYEYANNKCDELNLLLKLMREYCKEDIILVGFYNPVKEDIKGEKAFNFLNNKYKKISNKYNVTYINLQLLFENHFGFLGENKLLNQFGQNIIASEIINQIDKKILKG